MLFLNKDNMPRVKKTKVEKVKKVKVEKVQVKTKKDKGSGDAPKIKRKPSVYATFVKTHYKDKDVQAVPPKQRFGLIAKKWSEHKKKTKVDK